MSDAVIRQLQATGGDTAHLAIEEVANVTSGRRLIDSSASVQRLLCFNPERNRISTPNAAFSVGTELCSRLHASFFSHVENYAS